VTTTSWMLALLPGVTNVSDVADTSVTFVAATPPTVTDIVPRKLAPVTVTFVPPMSGPMAGDSAVTVGSGW